MRLFGLADFFGISNNEDDYESDIFVDEEVPVVEESKVEESKPLRQQYVEEETTEEKETVLPDNPVNEYIEPKIVDMNNYQSPSTKNKKMTAPKYNRKITVYEPCAYIDCKSIAQALFRKEIVIISFSAMEERQARRVVDFVTGTIYAIDGDIQRIGEEIFICTPANVEVDSSVAKSLISTHLPDY